MNLMLREYMHGVDTFYKMQKSIECQQAHPKSERELKYIQGVMNK